MVSSTAHVVNNHQSLTIFLVIVEPILGLSSWQVRASRWTYLGRSSVLYCNGTDDLFRGIIFVGWHLLKVLIWTGLAGGDTEYCTILMAVNSILQMVLYAPLAILSIRIISNSSTTVNASYSTVATSVAVFLGILLGAAITARFAVRKLTSATWYDQTFQKWIALWSLIGLLYTILVLFASQGH